MSHQLAKHVAKGAVDAAGKSSLALAASFLNVASCFLQIGLTIHGWASDHPSEKAIEDVKKVVIAQINNIEVLIKKLEAIKNDDTMFE